MRGYEFVRLEMDVKDANGGIADFRRGHGTNMSTGTQQLTKYRFGIARNATAIEHIQGKCDQTLALQVQ